MKSRITIVLRCFSFFLMVFGYLPNVKAQKLFHLKYYTRFGPDIGLTYSGSYCLPGTAVIGTLNGRAAVAACDRIVYENKLPTGIGFSAQFGAKGVLLTNPSVPKSEIFSFGLLMDINTLPVKDGSFALLGGGIELGVTPFFSIQVIASGNLGSKKKELPSRVRETGNIYAPYDYAPITGALVAAFQANVPFKKRFEFNASWKLQGLFMQDQRAIDYERSAIGLGLTYYFGNEINDSGTGNSQ